MANQRALVLMVMFGFSAIVGAYSVISSFMDLRAAEHEVDKSQEELLVAQSEVAVAQDRLDNLQKYGCESPAIGQGFVSCP